MDSNEWSINDAIEAIRSRGYIQDLPDWLATDESILSPEELNSSLTLLYYFINQMERVVESENKLGLPSQEQEQLIEVSGFGYDDIDLQTRLDRINADREHLLHNRAILMEQLQKSRHETAIFEQRLASADSAHREATKALTIDRDFLRRQVAEFKQRETQHQHETRRLEMDNESLREKLRSALSGGAKVSKSAVSSLPDSFSKSGSSTNTSASNITAASSTISRIDSTAQKNLKHRVDELERENEQLRVLLNSLADQVDSLLGSSGSSTSKRSNSKSSTSDIDSLQSLIKRQMEDLRNSSLQKRDYSQLSEVEALKEQLESCQRLIEEQHKLLTLAITPEPNRLFEPKFES